MCESGHYYLVYASTTGINDANLFIFASGEQFGSVPIPTRRIDQVGMAVNHNRRFARTHIPDDDQVVGTGREQYVLRRRVPQDETNSSLMVQQFHNWFSQRPIKMIHTTFLSFELNNTILKIKFQIYLERPWSGTCQTLTTQSSLPDAITLSLCGHQAMSKTGPLCPPTSGWSGLILPTLKKIIIIINSVLCVRAERTEGQSRL